MGTKHTPGEWFIAKQGTDEGGEYCMWRVFVNDDCDIAPANGCGYTMDEAQANACLIAAAPIGYELAQAVLDQMRDGLDRMEYINNKAADFVAKAKGE